MLRIEKSLKNHEKSQMRLTDSLPLLLIRFPRNGICIAVLWQTTLEQNSYSYTALQFYTCYFSYVALQWASTGLFDCYNSKDEVSKMSKILYRKSYENVEG